MVETKDSDVFADFVCRNFLIGSKITQHLVNRTGAKGTPDRFNLRCHHSLNLFQSA